MRIGGTRVGAVTDITPGHRQRRLGQRACSRSSSRPTVKPLPVDSTVLIRPRSALGLKYVEITKGTSSRGLRGRRDDPAAQRDARAGRDRRGPQHVRRQDARRIAEQPDASSATRFAGRGAGPQPGDRGAQPAADQPRAGHAEPRRTRARGSARFVQRARAHGARSSPRRPRRRRSCSATSTPPSAPSPTSRGPFLQDSISGGPPALDAAIEDFPQQRPFLANSEAPLPRAAPGRRARCATAAPDLADALEVGTPTLRRSVALNKRLKPAFEALRALRRRPAGHARRAATSTSTATILVADDRPPDAGPDGLQLRDAVVPQRRQPAQRRRRQRHQPALHHHRHAAGAQQRGRPVLGARQRRRPGPAGQLPAHQPVPEHRVARASRRSARPATSPSSSASRSSATCPATSPAKTETTKPQQ